MALEGEEGRLDHTNYGNDERQIWVIRGPEQSIIRLDFSSFHLETDFDFLWVYDGDNVYAPKIGRWNTQSPGVVEASGNTMCIEFRTDCLTTDAGWEASWTAFDTTHIAPEIIEPEPGVFPNPTEGKFTVKSGSVGFTDVTIFDVYGNMMLSERFTGDLEVDASDWAAGVYVVNYGVPVKLGKVFKLVKL